ncbi:MAG TPA: formyltransferase family protein, partial [Jatrophihabitantaceae bacterium]
MPNLVLTLVCRDRIGIVHAVSGFLTERQCNIVDSQQFGDDSTGRFFMRVNFVATDGATRPAELRQGFAHVAERFAMQWELHDSTVNCRTLLLVSKVGHCLNDLLYRWQIGALHVDIPAVVSNHPDVGALAAAYGVPFHHLPVTAETRADQESKLLGLIAEHRIDLVVLARYMQVLSSEMCDHLS